MTKSYVSISRNSVLKEEGTSAMMFLSTSNKKPQFKLTLTARELLSLVAEVQRESRLRMLDTAAAEVLSLCPAILERASPSGRVVGGPQEFQTRKQPTEEEETVFFPGLFPRSSPATSTFISLARTGSHAHSQDDHWRGE